MSDLESFSGTITLRVSFQTEAADDDTFAVRIERIGETLSEQSDKLAEEICSTLESILHRFRSVTDYNLEEVEVEED